MGGVRTTACLFRSARCSHIALPCQRLAAHSAATTNSVFSCAASVGNGAVSNDAPYAHLTYNFQDILTTYNYSCAVGHVSYAYDMYLGNSSYTEQQKSTNYNSTTNRNKVGAGQLGPAPVTQCLLDLTHSPPAAPAASAVWLVP